MYYKYIFSGCIFYICSNGQSSRQTNYDDRQYYDDESRPSGGQAFIPSKPAKVKMNKNKKAQPAPPPRQKTPGTCCIAIKLNLWSVLKGFVNLQKNTKQEMMNLNF